MYAYKNIVLNIGICVCIHTQSCSLLLFSHKVVSYSFEIPWILAHQTPLSVGFPRQEYWSGSPFPSPGDLPKPGIKPKCHYCAVLSQSVVSDFLQPCGLQPPRFLCSWGFSRQRYRGGLPCPAPGDLPNPGIKLRSPALQDDSSPSKPPGKPKNTGVDSQSLLQRIF